MGSLQRALFRASPLARVHDFLAGGLCWSAHDGTAGEGIGSGSALVGRLLVPPCPGPRPAPRRPASWRCDTLVTLCRCRGDTTIKHMKTCALGSRKNQSHDDEKHVAEAAMVKKLGLPRLTKSIRTFGIIQGVLHRFNNPPADWWWRAVSASCRASDFIVRSKKVRFLQIITLKDTTR